MNYQTSSFQHSTDSQAAFLELHKPKDFGVLAAKAVVGAARDFLNERLEELAEMHKASG